MPYNIGHYPNTDEHGNLNFRDYRFFVFDKDGNTVKKGFNSRAEADAWLGRFLNNQAQPQDEGTT